MNTIISQVLDTCISEFQNQNFPEYIQRKVYPYAVFVVTWSACVLLALLVVAYQMSRALQAVAVASRR